MRESVIEKALVKRVGTLGGEVRKVAWIGRRGAPDRFVMLQGPNKNIWVELKAPGVKAEDHQLREHDRMRLCGEIVIVIDSLDAIERWFPLPQPMTWRDYELSVRTINLLERVFPLRTLDYVTALDDERLKRLGFGRQDIKDIREVAESVK